MKHVVSSALLLGLSSLSLAAQAAPIVLDLPAQPLAASLEQLQGASGLRIRFDRAAVADRRAPALRGTLEPSEALQRLLAGSGLSGLGRRRLGRGRGDRCRHRPRRQRRPRRAQRGRHPGPGHRRHHRRQRLLHHAGDAHLDQAGDVDPRDPSVGQRGHPPAHGRPGHARPQRRGEGRHRPHRATVRAGPGEVRGARLRRRQHHVRRPADEHFHLSPGRHFRRRPGHVRPRRSGARRHRTDAGRRQPGGGDQHGAQASDPGLPRLPARQRRHRTAIAARPTFPAR